MADQVNLRPLILLEDEPVPGYWIDELGLRGFSETVAGAAIGTPGPFTIGVFADWGLGKTSVLNQAQSLIKNDVEQSDVVTVRFNVWRYEKEEHPILPLIATIVREIETKAEQNRKAKKQLREAWAAIVRGLRAVAYGFSTKAKLKIPGFAEMEAGFVAKEMISREHQLCVEGDPLLDRSIYYNAFEILESLSAATPKKPSRLLPKIIVFVDDLDRCLPHQGLRMLESVKLVFAQPGFVFVLAVDPRIINGYLEKRYVEEFNVSDYRSSGTSYLDKIVQLPLHLPQHNARFEAYVQQLLRRPAITSDKNVEKTLSELVDILVAGSNNNPRSLVRFINNLLVDRYMRMQRQESADKHFLRICAVSRSLQQHLRYRTYRNLASDNDLCSAIMKMREKPLQERCPESSDPVMQQHRKDVLDELGYYEFLVKLLDSESAGEAWLTRHEDRRSVDEFLAVQRTELLEEDQYERSGEVGATGTRLGAVLYELRLDRGLSQRDLATRIGVTPSRVSRFENGEMPPVDLLRTIAAALDTPVRTILERAELK